MRKGFFVWIGLSFSGLAGASALVRPDPFGGAGPGEFPTILQQQLLGGGGAESAASAAFTETEAASIGLNEAAERNDVCVLCEG
jgi:hypothetical protein